MWLGLWSITLDGMELAILGADTESVALATAAIDLGHEIVWCGDTAHWPSSSWSARNDQQEGWQALLDRRLCRAVIVGHGKATPAERQEQLSLLVKSGVPVLTTFPLVDSVLSYYEIDMVRSESGALLRHYNPLVEGLEPGVSWLQSDGEDVGRIEQVRLERPLADRSRENVLRHFARDVAILESVAGRFNRLGAHGSGEDSATYAGLSVQLIGKEQIPVQWSVRPGSQNDLARLVVIAERGEANAAFNSIGQLVGIGLESDGDATESSSILSANPAESAIENFEQALDRGGEHSTWGQALHCMELADTIEISLRRGRMIDVHAQQLTEELAFKGTMSAIGCGVLLILPPLLLLVGWLAGLAGIPAARSWSYVLLALLSLFLLIQFLPGLISRPPQETEANESD